MVVAGLFVAVHGGDQRLQFARPVVSPLLHVGGDVTPQNVNGVATIVPGFLCPSDAMQRATAGWGPTNYAACSGSGMTGGTPYNTDGIFYAASATRLSQVTDGASHTALFAESILGSPAAPPPRSASRLQVPLVIRSVPYPPVSTALCNGNVEWNAPTSPNEPRGFGWVSGEIRCAALQPLQHAEFDDVRLHRHPWKTGARDVDCSRRLCPTSAGERHAVGIRPEST